MQEFARICERDNVAVALKDLEPGAMIDVDGELIRLAEPIKFGHKIAISDIAKGEPVIKYCEKIGIATANIKRGEHVHIHNLQSTRVRR